MADEKLVEALIKVSTAAAESQSDAAAAQRELTKAIRHNTNVTLKAMDETRLATARFGESLTTHLSEDVESDKRMASVLERLTDKVDVSTQSTFTRAIGWITANRAVAFGIATFAVTMMLIGYFILRDANPELVEAVRHGNLGGMLFYPVNQWFGF